MYFFYPLKILNYIKINNMEFDKSTKDIREKSQYHFDKDYANKS